MFGTVCRHNDTVAPGSKILDHIHKELLVGVIQAGRGLVHHKDFSRLADRAGDQRQLALSSAEGGVFFIGKLQGIDLIKSLKGCITIDSLRTVKGRKMGGTAHEHHIQHGIGKDGRMVLWNIGDTVCKLSGGKL